MLQKAKIVGADGKTVEFQFNPETISFTQAAEFKEQSNIAGSKRQFVGTKPVELTLKMLLDEVTASGASVADRIADLLAWTTPADGEDPPHPHELKFSWGQLKVAGSSTFKCHCKSVAVEYTLFTPGGVPVRATATVVLAGIPPKKKGQNPTSGGVRPVRSHIVAQGDNLAAVAFAQYGQASAWRSLAELNNIDNPFRPPVGREIILPIGNELEVRR
ncbi:MAG: LysM peptidoglycan-binding domain-containing protein [Actinomycetota bacterium]